MSSKKAPKPSKEQNELAATQAQAMRDQLAFDREAFAEMLKRTDVADARGEEERLFQRGLAEESMRRSAEDRDFFYDTTGRQVRAFNDQVDSFDTAAERDAIAGRAMVDVETQIEAGRASLGREMAARGINPGSAASIMAMSDTQLSGSLAKASAATMAQEAARREGLQLRAQAAGLGSGFGGMAASGMGAASGFSATGLDASTLGTKTYSSGVGMRNQGGSVATGWGSSANSTFNSIAEQNYRRSQSSGGFGEFLGGVVGAGLGAFSGSWGSAAGTAFGKTSDRRLKTDITPVGRLDNGLTVYSYRYKTGGPVEIGVMADEVALLKPEAYIPGGAGNGYDAVNYGAL